MLILLGILNLTGVTRWLSERFSPAHPQVTGEHVHIHAHGSHVHYHWHTHQPAAEHHGEALAAPGWLWGAFAKLGIFHSLRPLLIGIVHGLAGSAAVALLVLTTIHDPRWGVFYLLIICFLSDRVCGRVVHQPSELDAEIRSVAQAFRPEGFPRDNATLPTQWKPSPLKG